MTRACRPPTSTVNINAFQVTFCGMASLQPHEFWGIPNGTIILAKKKCVFSWLGRDLSFSQHSPPGCLDGCRSTPFKTTLGRIGSEWKRQSLETLWLACRICSMGFLSLSFSYFNTVYPICLTIRSTMQCNSILPFSTLCQRCVVVRVCPGANACLWQMNTPNTTQKTPRLKKTVRAEFNPFFSQNLIKFLIYATFSAIYLRYLPKQYRPILLYSTFGALSHHASVTSTTVNDGNGVLNTKTLAFNGARRITF